jgi:DNA-binding response OmpR family regulator
MKKIAVITESQLFNDLIINLRKNNFDTKKCSPNQSLEEFDTLIIDLDFPLEQSYNLLQKIKSDYKYSETVVLVILK